MLAWTVENWGLAELALVERPSPSPGPGEVKVAFSAVSLNYRDLLVVKGLYNPKFSRPLVPCSDGFGTVVEIGSGVDPTLMGRSVLSLFCPEWHDGAPTVEVLRQTLGGPLAGVLQQERCFHPSQLVFLEEPSALTAWEWATLPCAGVTAWNCLVEHGRLAAGQTVLLLGTGGVSLFGLQIAKMMGARVLLLSSSQEKRARAKELGADSVHCYRSDPNWSRWVLEHTQGRGVDIVLETGGAGTLGESLKSVAVGGHVALVGVLSGSSEELNILPLVMKAVTVRGGVVGSKEHSIRLQRAYLQNFKRPVVHEVHHWSDARAAFESLESGRQFGKIVVDLSSDALV